MKNRRYVQFFIFIIIPILVTTITCSKTSDPNNEQFLRELLTKYSDLKDPSSVQFRSLKYITDKGNTSGAGPLYGWEGEINAKNSLGGYVGWQPFKVRYSEFPGLKDSLFISIGDSEEQMFIPR